MERPYSQLQAQIRIDGNRADRMQHFVDAAWPLLAPTNVSWLGFYFHEGGDELILGPRRDKPACSPIGLHGVCGQAFRDGSARIVRDVAELGDHYVACDPRDRSELVVPLFDTDGRCWGVFDMDSFSVGAFDEADATALRELLMIAGLTAR